jgi:hypothetical protein
MPELPLQKDKHLYRDLAIETEAGIPTGFLSLPSPKAQDTPLGVAAHAPHSSMEPPRNTRTRKQ